MLSLFREVGGTGAVCLSCLLCVRSFKPEDCSYGPVSSLGLGNVVKGLWRALRGETCTSFPGSLRENTQKGWEAGGLEQRPGESAPQAVPAWVAVDPDDHLPPPPCSSRVKPAGSVNDVGLDALDLDRMKQVRACRPGARGGKGSVWVPYSLRAAIHTEGGEGRVCPGPG